MNELAADSLPSPTEILQIESICDGFEAAWKAGERPRLEAFLGDTREPLRTRLLRQLLPLDWEYRVRAGDEPKAADYELRFPAASSWIEAIGREITTLTPVQALSPQRLGEYRILRELGRGGMGIVYEALHEPLNRRVALKLLPGVNLTDSVARERFRREAQMTAQLNHPNIVQILEVGEHAGQPFLALEFVAGPSLADRLRGAPQPSQQSAALIETLARAVHYAHEQGIIHRDLKPANILLHRVESRQNTVDSRQTLADGKRSSWQSKTICMEEMSSVYCLLTSDYTPKITDFGLAHPVGAGELTATGEIVGTPAYMAPEQAWGKSKGLLVGPGADVYALGAILYVALTGMPPFQGSTALDALEQVRFHEPVPPSQLHPQVPRDLETICLKCLQKDPAKRYPSALALAEDLRRFQKGEPIRARRTSVLERVLRWCRRNPSLAVAAVLGVLVVASAAAFVVNYGVMLKLRKEQTLTETALENVKIQQARAEKNAEQLADQQEQTEAALVEADRFRRKAERLSASMALERGLSLLEQGEVARGMLLLGHSLQIAPAEADDLQHVIRANLGAASRQLAYHLHRVIDRQPQVRAAAFSPDGKVLLTGGRIGGPRRWDVATGQPIGAPLPHDGEIMAVAFSSDGSLIATASTDETVRLWDAATGTPVGKPLVHKNWVLAVAISPDGKTVLTGSADRTAKLWESATGKQIVELPFQGWVRAVAFSPDGKTFVTDGSTKSAQLWDLATAKPIGETMRHQDEVWSIAFSPDGRTLLTGSDDGTAQLWEANTGKHIFPILHQGPVRSVGFSADGRIFWTGGISGKVRLWDTATLKPLGAPVQHPSAVYAVALSPDQRLLTTGSTDRKLRIWEKSASPPAAVVLPHDGSVYCLAVSPNGRTIVTGSADKSARIWDTATGESIGKPLLHGASILRVTFSPDGRTILTGSADKTARLWDAATGEPRGSPLQHADHLYAVAFSPDGQTILTGCKDSTARLWNAATGEPIGKPIQHPRWVHAAVFSPDGKTILTGCEDSTARLWDAKTLEPLGEPLHHRGPVRAVAFSPDSRMLLTGTWDDGTARLWDTATRKSIGPPLAHQEHVLTVAFSPDGKTVATGAWDGSARLWDVATGKPLGTPLVHGRTIRDVAFSPDGKTLWTASFDRTARSWEVPTAVTGDVDLVVRWIQVLTGMELDSDGLFRGLDSATFQQRQQILADQS